MYRPDDSWEEEMNDTVTPDDSVPAGCEICGREDETVRFVVYPYVFSVIVLTYQRAFIGSWCNWHRFQKWLTASLITIVFGWWGIPFGLIFTPIRLLELARGGTQNNKINGEILRTIAKNKRQQGNVQGEINCLENSLEFEENQETEEQLRYLYRLRSTEEERSFSNILGFFVFPLIFLAANLGGILIGFLDQLFQAFLSSIISEFPIYLVIAMQIPLAIMLYISVTLFLETFGKAIELTKYTSKTFLVMAGTLSILFLINGVLSGNVYAVYRGYGYYGLTEEMPNTLKTLGAILTHGILFVFRAEAFEENGAFWTFLFAGILFAMFVVTEIALHQKINQISTHQLVISRLKDPNNLTEKVQPFPGWIGVAATMVIFVLLFAAFPQKSSVDTLVGFEHFAKASNFIDNNNYEHFSFR
jgi:hypothetical protein